MITISELYLDGIKITNIETKNLDQNREFMTKHFVDMEEKTEIPTTKSFTFSISGVLSKDDAAHATFLDMPLEPLELEFYLGRKAESLGYRLPVYVEDCSINHTGGEAVEIDITFREAGPLVRI